MENEIIKSQNNITVYDDSKCLLTNEERFYFVKAFDSDEIEGHVEPEKYEVSDDVIYQICRDHAFEVLNPESKYEEEFLKKLPLNAIVQGINNRFPENYSDTWINYAFENTTEKLGLEKLKKFFGYNSLLIKEIDDILSKLITIIQPGQGNKEITGLCRVALWNPYTLKESTFQKWLSLLLKNHDENVFLDLSEIFEKIDENDKNLPEKILKYIIQDNSQKPRRNPFSKAFKNYLEDQREKARARYYGYGMNVLKEVAEWLPEGTDITRSLGSLNSFLTVLDKDSVPDKNNQLETFVLRLFAPGRVKIEIDTNHKNPETINTLSNIFKLAIKYMTDPAVKRTFIERMFALENGEQIAITRSEDILKTNTIELNDKASGYDIDTKKTIIRMLCELYTKDTIAPEQQSTIREIIEHFIITEKEQNSKEFAFSCFSNILNDKERKQIYAHILSMDFDDSVESAESYKIIKMHREIQESDFEEAHKLNSINNMCKFYFESKSPNKINDTYKTAIMSFMAEVLINYKKNTIAIRDKITGSFYDKLSPKEEKKNFLIHILNKCENNKTIIANLPQSIQNAILDSDLEAGNKEEVIIANIEKFVYSDNSDANIIMDYLMDAKTSEISRRKVLGIILDKLKENRKN